MHHSVSHEHVRILLCTVTGISDFQVRLVQVILKSKVQVSVLVVMDAHGFPFSFNAFSCLQELEQGQE